MHSGTVHDILLPHQPGEKVTVVMDLGKSTHEIIKKDSVVTIETEGLLGNQYLAISFGSAKSANVENDDTLASQAPLEMSELPLAENPAAFWTAPGSDSECRARNVESQLHQRQDQ